MRPALCLAPLLAAALTLEAAPNIDHLALECIEPGRFAVVLSGIAPGDQIQTAKVYFRSSLYRDFYYVEMTQEGASFVGILPQPLPETPRIVYYVEAVDQGFESTRSSEFDPPVKHPCKDRPGLAYLPSEPGITVGAVAAGASPLPPGFSAAGIIGTITALGVSSGIGGGIGAGTAVAIAAGAAGVTGAVVVTQSGETTASTTTAAGTTSVFSSPPATTTSPPTTSAPGPTTTSVSPNTTTSTPTTTAPPTTSAPSSTTTSVAPTTTTSTPTTTSSSSTTTAPPPVTACFSTTKMNSCVWQFDATCSSGPIVSYDWVIDPAGTMPAPRPPVNQSGPVVTVDWNPPTFGGCSGSPLISVQLTVTGSLGQTDAKGQSVTIDLRATGARPDLRTSATSFLGVLPFDGTSHGFIMLNRGRTEATSNATPYHHVFGGVAGRNTIEAYTDHPGAAESFWRFDFSAAAHFVPESLRVESGTVLSLDARSIVFRLTGTTGERIKFSFELSP